MRDEKLLLASIALAAKRVQDNSRPFGIGDYVVDREAMENLKFAIRVFIGETPESPDTSI